MGFRLNPRWSLSRDLVRRSQSPYLGRDNGSSIARIFAAARPAHRPTHLLTPWTRINLLPRRLVAGWSIVGDRKQSAWATAGKMLSGAQRLGDGPRRAPHR